MLPIHVVLHPTDFSAHSAPAFDVACTLARDNHARLLILYVREVPAVAYGEFGHLPMELESPEAIRAKLDKLISLRCRDGNVAAECCIKIGDPATEILATANEIHADMIVMGTHGRTGLGRLLMGSVAEFIVRKATCPVLTVKAPMEKAPACETVCAEPAHA